MPEISTKQHRAAAEHVAPGHWVHTDTSFALPQSRRSRNRVHRLCRRTSIAASRAALCCSVKPCRSCSQPALRAWAWRDLINLVPTRTILHVVLSSAQRGERSLRKAIKNPHAPSMRLQRWSARPSKVTRSEKPQEM